MDIRAEGERLERILLGQEVFVNTVKGWLEEERSQDEIIRAVIRTARPDRVDPIPGLDPTRTYHEKAIRQLCIKYRLRFLPGASFRGDIPDQAVVAVRNLERRTGTTLSAFHVLAPVRRFELVDCESDPLLFLRVAEDRYFLVHRWGGDLAWYRSFIAWPLRSPLEGIVTLTLFVLMIAAFVPTGWITAEPDAPWWGIHRFVILFWIMMVTAGSAAYGWFAFFGRFSSESWRSRTFN
ncbi:MAG: hypothetical protein H6595_02375 [Flavobacteriales bacterium]|nr:hypothetical protein [Flavobacteriales bacterium]MCB9166305.1 hypothetical protein [Flavobacteriales bacterium]